MDDSRQPGIQIGQIFLEQASFSHRDDALTLPVNTLFQPNLTIKLEAGVAPDGKTAFIRIAVHTKKEERPLYNFSVTMMALLQVVEGQDNLSLKEYLQGGAPAMLYPFVREAVAGLTWRGHFGPVWLAPFNIAGAMHPVEEPLPKIQKAPKLEPSKQAKRAEKKRTTARR